MEKFLTFCVSDGGFVIGIKDEGRKEGRKCFT